MATQRRDRSWCCLQIVGSTHQKWLSAPIVRAGRRGCVADLPTGTVTFLFTDIESSSSRWDTDRDAMAAALAVHNQILDEAIAAAGGQTVKTMGDGYMVAFSHPAAAISAAVHAQGRLGETAWEGEPITVRMGLHTGNVDLVDGDYFGPDVNRAARIEAAGHGGQILASASTRELSAGSISGDITLISLGRHELRGLTRPEQIYQVTAHGLASEFPPLRTAEAGAVRNAPGYHTSFVGRQLELADIEADLTGDVRLLTLLGQGGAGKTRLAAEAMRRVAGSFAHGAVFCPLASIHDEALIVGGIIEALGFTVDTHSSGDSPLSQLVDYLSSRSILIVLDNFEHLLGGTATVEALLGANPGIRVLVTSREKLRLSAESVISLGGLDGGDDSHEASSIQLFVERAQQVEPGLDPSKQAADIARICRLVDGLPLGIELAAAWSDMLGPGEIADEITSNLDFLESQERDRDQRHRSLRATFDWSWTRLEPELQDVLRRLAVFEGGFDREAATEVVGADLRSMSTLVAKSLVRRPTPGRFDLHPLVGQYAAERLTVDPDIETELRSRHAAYYRSLLISERAGLESSGQNDVRDELRHDLDNLRQALVWTADHAPPGALLEAMDAIYLFYLCHSWHEAIEMLADLSARLRQRNDAPDDAEFAAASADGAQATFATHLGDLDVAEQITDRAIPILEEHAPGVGIICAVYAAAGIHILRGDHSIGRPLAERALALADPAKYPTLYSLLCTIYGWSFYEVGDFQRADEIFSDGLRVADAAGAQVARAYSLSKLGLTAGAAGDHQRAINLHQEGREAFVKMGDPAGEAYTLSRLAWTHWLLGDFEESRESALEGLFGFEQINHRWGISATLSRLGFAELGLGELDDAESHFRRAVARAADAGMANLERYGEIGLGCLAAARGDDAVGAEALTILNNDETVVAPYKRDFIAPTLAKLEARMSSADWAEFAAPDRLAASDRLAALLGLS